MSIVAKNLSTYNRIVSRFFARFPSNIPFLLRLMKLIFGGNMEKISKDNKRNSRANKVMSTKIIIPKELFNEKENITKVMEILEYIKKRYNKEEKIHKIMTSLCLNLLIQKQLLTKKLETKKSNVRNFVNEYNEYFDDLLEISLPEGEDDILGIIYQCLQTEGKKNEKGSYYTPKSIVKNMIKDIKNTNALILDPCCGTGMFLLNIKTDNPNNLYGTDIDDIAIMICKINLILKYKEYEFEPKIKKLDFFTESASINEQFDYIITNPPWGADTSKVDKSFFYEIDSGESFSYVIYNASKLLKECGKMIFLLPISFTNVKVHADIRKYLLGNYKINNIIIYPKNFSGVVTKFVSIEVENRDEHNYNILISDTNQNSLINKEEILNSYSQIISLVAEEEKRIIDIIYQRDYSTLKDSKWALGIVTGDNKNKLKKEYKSGYDKIYTGKEISEYSLLPCKNYIEYKREDFQQVAPEEIYRAKEKIVYKFVSKNITFAYDDKQELFLNSANILIPNIEGLGTKTILAFLNSELFRFVYLKRFNDVKILRGNLEQLPFPRISKEKDNKISRMVDEVLNGNNRIKEDINDEIYTIFELNSNEINTIKESLYGKIK